MLLTLAASPLLTRWILADLLSSISLHSDYLRDLSLAADGKLHQFNVVEYENMCIVFRIVEEIVLGSDIISDPKGVSMCRYCWFLLVLVGERLS